MSEFRSNFCPSEQTPFLSQTSFLAKENNFYFNGKIKATEKIEGYHNQNCPIWNFYHQDHLGNTRVITDDQGNVIAEHKYFPYGEELTSHTQDTLSHRFTGHERDFESNLDYMHARYYNSFIGRFLSVDTVNFKYSLINHIWNRYVYAGNNPFKFIDRTGLWLQIAGTEYKEELREILVKTAQKETGRIILNSMAKSTSYYNIKHENLNPNFNYTKESIEKKVKEHGKMTIGLTTKKEITVDGQNKKEINISIDINALTAFHKDKSGVTTLSHEWYHAIGLEAGQCTADNLNLDKIDPMTNLSPAEAFGFSVSAESDTVSQKEAEQMVDQWLMEAMIEQFIENIFEYGFAIIP